MDAGTIQIMTPDAMADAPVGSVDALSGSDDAGSDGSPGSGGGAVIATGGTTGAGNSGGGGGTGGAIAGTGGQGGRAPTGGRGAADAGTGGAGTGGAGTGGAGTGGAGTGGAGPGGAGSGGAGTAGAGTGGAGGGAASPLAIEFVTGHSMSDPFSSKQVNVSCPTGTQALGATWSLSEPNSTLVGGRASYFLPSFDGRSWLVNGDLGLSGPTWQLDVTVACGSVAGYRVVTSTSPTDATARKSINVDCPTGTQALGAGWAVLDPTNGILDGDALQFQMSPTGTGWQIAASNRSTVAATWKLQGTVLCATIGAVPGYQIVTEATAVSLATQHQGTASCAPPKRPVAGGWRLFDGAGTTLDGTAFISTVNGSYWLLGAGTGQSANAGLEIRVVCVN